MNEVKKYRIGFYDSEGNYLSAIINEASMDEALVPDSFIPKQEQIYALIVEKLDLIAQEIDNLEVNDEPEQMGFITKNDEGAKQRLLEACRMFEERYPELCYWGLKDFWDFQAVYKQLKKAGYFDKAKVDYEAINDDSLEESKYSKEK